MSKFKSIFFLFIALFLFQTNTTVFAKDVSSSKISLSDLDEADQRYLQTRYEYVSNILTTHLKKNNNTSDLEKFEKILLKGDIKKRSLEDYRNFFSSISSGYFERYYSLKEMPLIVTIQDITAEHREYSSSFESIGSESYNANSHIDLILRIATAMSKN